VWSETILIALISGIPAILTSLATLIFVLRGNSKVNHLDETVNGKFSEMLDAVKVSSKMEGKVETIEKVMQPTAPITTIMVDRRRE